jgi:heme/copper-type cytochrome/quinol oxidase subunit 3
MRFRRFNFNFKKFKEKHPFHIVTKSPWPFFLSISSLCLAISLVLFFHFYKTGLFCLLFSISNLLYILFNWFFDVIAEATLEGKHTSKVNSMYMMGFVLFIISEIAFFITFFWTDLHLALNPNLNLNVSWPPPEAHIHLVNHSGLPAYMNIFLLLSSFTAVMSHHGLLVGHRNFCLVFLAYTIIIGIIFSTLQYIEYISGTICFSDSSMGSLLYMLTGFHGVHVIIGNVFLVVCFVRIYYEQFTVENHKGFLLALLYWHFVDLIWLFVYFIEYASIRLHNEKTLLACLLYIEIISNENLVC